MYSAHKPSVFVSSTCYDLRQVRHDIKDALISLGLDPVLSEFDEFPVSPTKSTIENCLQNVRARADIFILIVGGRYGSTINTGKSITNLEYIEAKRKGTPVYIFISKEITNILPLWHKNKDADFSGVVDNIKLFSFVDELKNSQENWVYSFESAQDIKNILLQQLPYLFMDALNIKRIIEKNGYDFPMERYSPEAISLILHKDDGWEFKLLVELLKYYISLLSEKRLDLDYGVSFGEKRSFKEPTEVTRLLSDKIDELSSHIELITKLINEGIKRAVGEPGHPGDHEQIQYVCKRIIDVYSQIIDWRLSFLDMIVEDKFRKLLDLASNIVTETIDQIEHFIGYAYKEVNEAIDNHTEHDEPRTLTLTLDITLSDTAEFHSELERLEKQFN